MLQRSLDHPSSLEPSAELISWLRGQPINVQTVTIKAGVEVDPGDARFPRIITSGWLARHVTIDDKRQILGLLLPGDSVALYHHAPAVGEKLIALSGVTMRDARPLLMKLGDAAADSVSRRLSESELFMTHQIMRLGRMTALQRVSHLFCELCFRIDRLGNLSGRYDVPLKQQDISDILGLSAVHVNRTLQDMRRRRWVTLERGTLIVLDRLALAQAGLFDLPPAGATRPART